MYRTILAMFLAVVLCFGVSISYALALDFEAQSVFVMDGNTREELYSYNGDVVRVPASMTKVLTEYIVYQ